MCSHYGELYLGLVHTLLAQFTALLSCRFTLVISVITVWSVGELQITNKPGPVNPKFQVQAVAPHQSFFFSEN